MCSEKFYFFKKFNDYTNENEDFKDLNQEKNKELNISIQPDNKVLNILNSVIESKDKDIKHLQEENKKLLDLLEQSNQLLHTEQQLQQKALSNTELLLLEKRQQLLIRESQYHSKKKLALKDRIRILFYGK